MGLGGTWMEDCLGAPSADGSYFKVSSNIEATKRQSDRFGSPNRPPVEPRPVEEKSLATTRRETNG